MEIKLERIHVEDNPINEVTSFKIFKDYIKSLKDDKYPFHEKGIFSRKIFGKYGRCDCGNLSVPGICENCEVRVLDKSKQPDFYIKLNCNIPTFNVDLDHENKDEIIKLLNYDGFLYDKKFYNLDLDNMNFDDFDNILFGKDAIMEYGLSEEWYNQNTTDKIYIPHPSFRKIINSGNKHHLGKLNTAYIEILRKKDQLSKFEHYNQSNQFAQLLTCKEILNNVSQAQEEIFNIIAANKNSLVNKEIKGQNISGAIRAVIINNYSLNEDDVLIGSYYIKTLYPKLYEKFSETVEVYENNKYKKIIKEGTCDIDKLNDYLKNNNYLVLTNRAPTIGEKSIIAQRPIFSKDNSSKYVAQLNPIIFDSMAADVDGDVCLFISLYTRVANEDAFKLLPSQNYIGSNNNTIRNNILEDFIYAAQN